jgi:hypothetical protein
MSMTDPIADLLTRIRNATREKHEKLEVPALSGDLVQTRTSGQHLRPGKDVYEAGRVLFLSIGSIRVERLCDVRFRGTSNSI